MGIQYSPTILIVKNVSMNWAVRMELLLIITLITVLISAGDVVMKYLAGIIIARLVLRNSVS